MTSRQKLIEKYNKPVPRYTSYPPANKFHKIEENNFIDSLASADIKQPQNIAFYFHVPFCKKICSFCGCNSCSTKSEKKISKYFDALVSEFKERTKHINKSRKVSQIHFGGGTPNWVKTNYIEKILKMVFSEFNFIIDPEIAMECNPAYLDEEKINIYTSFGINRFSLGIQDFNKNIVNSMNRDYPEKSIDKIYEEIKKNNNKAGINLDFVYGLPGQTHESTLSSIKKAVSLSPDRIVTFSYAHVPWVKSNQKAIKEESLPSEKEKIKMYEESKKFLIDNNYIAIGLDHYVNPQDELTKALNKGLIHRNFQGYCTKRTTGQVYAFGSSSISQLESGYFQNIKDIDIYTEKSLNKEYLIEKGYITKNSDKIIREVINIIMCNLKLDWEILCRNLGMPREEILKNTSYKEKYIKEMIDDGILKKDNNNLIITEPGRLFMRNVASAFDPEYKNEENKYSKTV